MAVQIHTEKQLRACQDLPFCYLCAAPIQHGLPRDHELSRTRDHVVPNSVIAKQDHPCPLILPVHLRCNAAFKADDELIGQMLSPLHGRYPNQRSLKIKPVALPHPGSGQTVAGVQGPDLNRLVRRWVSGFHAALYRQFLSPSHRDFAVTLPFPESDPATKLIRNVEPQPAHQAWVATLRTAEGTGDIDKVTCYGGKCEYRCTWSSLDNGSSCCVFALRLHDWQRLANKALNLPRACVGTYFGIERPRHCARASRLLVGYKPHELLDPFD